MAAERMRAPQVCGLACSDAFYVLSSFINDGWRTCRFDGVGFLATMRGKTVMFVGDSLGRNQWQSLICMLAAAAPQSQTQFVRGEPLSTYKFLVGSLSAFVRSCHPQAVRSNDEPLWLLQDSGVSVSFYRAPYLVDIDVVQGRRILMLNEITGNAEAWRGADVLCFNSGHWWTHKGALQGCNSCLIFVLVCCDLVEHKKDKLCRWDYMGDAGSFYEDMDRLVAFQKGMSTWANWVDATVDRTKTKVFFQSISPTHYK